MRIGLDHLATLPETALEVVVVAVHLAELAEQAGSEGVPEGHYSRVGRENAALARGSRLRTL